MQTIGSRKPESSFLSFPLACALGEHFFVDHEIMGRILTVSIVGFHSVALSTRDIHLSTIPRQVLSHLGDRWRFLIDAEEKLIFLVNLSSFSAFALQPTDRHNTQIDTPHDFPSYFLLAPLRG